MQRRAPTGRPDPSPDAELDAARTHAGAALERFERALDVQIEAFGAERWSAAPAEIRDRYRSEREGRLSGEAMQAWWRYLAHRRLWSQRCTWTLSLAARLAPQGDRERAMRLVREAAERAEIGCVELMPLADDAG